MTKRLDLAPGFAPPIDLMVQKIAVLARTGAGKTNTAVVFAEEVLEAGQQVVVLDPKGDWYGLRSSADGKSAGYPITVLGGDHGDLPLEPTGGAVIADVAAEGVSMVIDLSSFSGSEMRRFVTDFAERFYRAKKDHVSPVLLIVEEADEVVPQRFTGESARMVGAMERIVKRARFRGVGSMLVTQRSASLNKDVLTQTEVLIVQQTTSPQDRKAIDAWVESHPDQEKRAELMANIASLKKGEAFVWSPTFLETFKRVRFRMRRTYDAGRDVKIGELRAAPKVLAPVDLAALGERMKATVERQKADDPRALRAEVVRLKKELTVAINEASAMVQPPPARPVERRVEVAVLRNGTSKALTKAASQLLAASTRLYDASQVVAQAAATIGTAVQPVLDELARIQSTPTGVTATKETVAVAPVRAGASTSIPVKPATTRGQLGERALPRADRVGPQHAGGPPARTIGKGEHAVLRAVAQHDAGVTREQLTVLTGYKRSTRNAYVQRLVGAGYVQDTGDTVAVTDAGFDVLGPDFEPLPTGDALRAYWLGRLGGGERVILATLCDIYPKDIARDDLSESTEYARSSRNAYLQRLRARRVVEVIAGGRVRAADALFS